RSRSRKASGKQDHNRNFERPERPASAAASVRNRRSDRSISRGAGEVKNFLSTADLSGEELVSLVDAALRLNAEGNSAKPLAGKSVGLVFFSPSRRTCASMQVGIYELGGNPVILEPGSTSWTLEHREGVVMDGGKTEH